MGAEVRVMRPPREARKRRQEGPSRMERLQRWPGPASPWIWDFWPLGHGGPIQLLQAPRLCCFGTRASGS